MARSTAFVIGALFLISSPVGCSKKTHSNRPEGAALERRPLPPIEVTSKSKLLFTFRDGPGLKTVERLDDIPAPARGWVRVVDPKKPAVASGLVYVADLRKPDAQGRYPYGVMSRKQFLQGMPSGGAGMGPPMAAPPSAASASVILYSRPGCPACRATRIYLKQRGIPFVERDVADDPAAARELAAKAKRAGIAANVVPILDVNGDLVVGFDTQKIERLLRSRI